MFSILDMLSLGLIGLLLGIFLMYGFEASRLSLNRFFLNSARLARDQAKRRVEELESEVAELKASRLSLNRFFLNSARLARDQAKRRVEELESEVAELKADVAFLEQELDASIEEFRSEL